MKSGQNRDTIDSPTGSTRPPSASLSSVSTYPSLSDSQGLFKPHFACDANAATHVDSSQQIVKPLPNSVPTLSPKISSFSKDQHPNEAKPWISGEASSLSEPGVKLPWENRPRSKARPGIQSSPTFLSEKTRLPKRDSATLGHAPQRSKRGMRSSSRTKPTSRTTSSEIQSTKPSNLGLAHSSFSNEVCVPSRNGSCLASCGNSSQTESKTPANTQDKSESAPTITCQVISESLVLEQTMAEPKQLEELSKRQIKPKVREFLGPCSPRSASYMPLVHPRMGKQYCDDTSKLPHADRRAILVLQ
mmetsp:Transcript_2614/g.4816  ORF Transcript_2614/g.4816 Transcript_2614/m.4816 type:complete len:303 (+) Transcript_2614:2-910(+)